MKTRNLLWLCLIFSSLHFADAQSCSAGQQYGDYTTYTDNPNKYCSYYSSHYVTQQSNQASFVDACKDGCNEIRAGNNPSFANCYGFHVPSWLNNGYEECKICYYNMVTRSSSNYDTYLASSSTGCHACPVGTYKGSGSGLCNACPTGKSTSGTGSTSSSQCNICSPGYHGSSCSPCALGSYKDTTGTQACTVCWQAPSSWPSWALTDDGYGHGVSYSQKLTPMITTSTGSAEYSDCLCPAGTLFSEDYSLGNHLNHVCIACDPGAIQPDDAHMYDAWCRYDCGTSSTDYNSWSWYGASECVCNVGYYWDATWSTCQGCEPGKYKPDLGDSVSLCVNCPTGSTSVNYGTTDVSQCICDIGYESINDVCQPCPAGEYGHSASTCTNCPAGKYQTGTGKTSVSDCLSCPDGGSSSAGSDALADCLCNAGYTGPNGGTCTQCAAGKFKTAAGSAACADCQAGYESSPPHYTDCLICPQGEYEDTSQFCAACPANSYTSTAGTYFVGDCQCNAGYYLSDPIWTICSPCAAGTYSNSLGSACTDCNDGQTSVSPFTSCVNCAANTYESDGVCVDCGANYISTSGSTACTLVCAAGEYSNSYSGTSWTKNWYYCSTSAYYTNLGSSCCNFAACSTACIDAVDSNGNNCAGITIKNNYGLGETNEANAQYCRLCFPGYSEVPNTNYVFWALDQAEGEECVNCPAQAPLSPEGSSSVDACFSGCDAGQAFDTNDVCQNCDAGKYQPNSAHTGACIDCPANTDSASGSDASADCLCNTGYTGPNGGPCVECEAGKFKSDSGSAGCNFCIDHSNNEYYVNGGTTTNERVGLSTSGSGSSTCDVCVANAESSSGTCKCSAGYYRAYTFFNNNDLDRCDACPINTYKSTVDVVSGCQSDYTWSDGYAGCADYEVTIFAYDADYCAYGDSYSRCCVCSNQYDVANGGAYGDGNPETMIWVQSQCTACPDNSYATTTANVDATSCKCNVGYTGPDGGPCVGCEVGKYKDAAGSAECTACAQHKTSPEGSESADVCVCEAGYGLEACRPAGGARIWCNKYTKYLPNGEDWNDERIWDASTEQSLYSCLSNEDFDWHAGRFSNMWIWATDDRFSIFNQQTSVEASSPNLWEECADGAKCNWVMRTNSRPVMKLWKVGDYVYPDTPDPSTLPCAPGTGGCSSCDEAGEYYKASIGDYACVACHANSVGVNGQSCICNAGYYLSAPDTCLQCDVGTWKSGFGNATGGCTTCGEHMTTLNTESTGIESCLCNAGYYGNYDGCQSCAAGTYTNSVGNTICTDCPVGSSSLTNTNDEESDCVADVGYEKLDGVYTECQIGFYKNTIENTLCSECLHGSTTASTGSTQNTQCECIPPNYYGNAGDECLCADGYARWHDHDDTTMRRLLSHENCNLCEAGKFCPAETNSGRRQLLNSDTVSSCPANSNSPAGSSSQTDCICDAGYTGPDGGPCVQCGVGKYKDAAGSQGCTDCAQHETSPMGSVSLGACVCEAGYGYDGSTCTDCAPGSYKDVSGDLGCTSCAQHETSPEGSVSADACLCVAGYGSTSTYTYSVQSGRYCAQDYWGADQGGDPITIEECADHCSADENCLKFEIEPYLTDLHYCKLCSHDLTYVAAGWFVYVKDTEPSFVCSECVAGKYKDAIGDAECTDCAQHETSPDGSVSADACVCSGGFEHIQYTYLESNWEKTAGKMCTRNTGVNNFGNQGNYAAALAACKQHCLNNAQEPYYSYFNQKCVGIHIQDLHSNHNQCNMCEENNEQWEPFYSSNQFFDVYLLEQESVTATICQECAAAKYKITDANTACDDCPADTTSPTGSDELTDCFCNAGYSGSNGGVCTICPTDTYQDTPGSSTCETCPGNSQSPQGSVVGDACLCNAGYEESTDSVCMTCPNGKFKTSASHDPCSQCRSHAYTDSDGSTLSSECLCNAGYYDNGGTCEQCLSGTYKTGLGDGECTSCPDNSDSPQGSILENQCICNAGYEISVSGASISCAACNPNFYEDSNVCIGCPENSQSAALSTSVSDCKCNQGYTGPDGGECTACGTDKYKDSVGSSSCASCEANMNSPAASTTSGACLCNAGFSRNLGASVNRRLLSLLTCQSCLADTYCPPENTVETTSVNVCPDNSNSPAGSDELTDCKCNKGYAGPDGQACQICEYNYYTDTIGSPTCLACPEYSTTTNQASTGIDLCNCDQLYKRSGDGGSTVCHRECGPGFEASDDESRCVGCRVSHYKPDYGDHDCTKCPGVSYSLVQNQTALNSCICPQGYLWNDGGCDQCEAGTFNNRANQTACFDCQDGCGTNAVSNWIKWISCNNLLQQHSIVGDTPTGSPGTNYVQTNDVSYWESPKYAAGTTTSTYLVMDNLNIDLSVSFNIYFRFAVMELQDFNIYLTIYSTGSTAFNDGHGNVMLWLHNNPFNPTELQLNWNGQQSPVTVLDVNENTGITEWIEVRLEWDTGGAMFVYANNVIKSTLYFASIPDGPYKIFVGGHPDNPTNMRFTHFLVNTVIAERSDSPSTEDLTCLQLAGHTSCPGLCRAPAGYRVNSAGNNVELCPINHYQDGTAASCTKCPSPSTYSSEGGLTSVTACECRPGYTRVGGSEGTCEPCLTGTYKAESGDAACILCGENANTVGVLASDSASDSVLACLCQPGYTQSGDQCAACAQGNTKHILSNVSCIQCPEHSTLHQDKQHHIDHCQCDPGYSGSGGNSPCVACEVGKFSVLHENEMQCHDCPVHATTESAASKNESFCVCESLYEPSESGGPWDGHDCISSCGPGFTGTGSSCQKCAVGSFKTQRGGESCTLCTGVRLNSRPGSISSTNCSCVQGKFGVDSNKFVVIASVGGWSESGVKVVSDFTQASSTFSEFTYNLLDGEAYRSVLLKPGVLDLDVLNWQISVEIDNLLLFSCTFKDCPEEKEVLLSGLQGVLKVSGYVKANGNLQLYTRRTLTLQSSYSLIWSDQLQAQAENLVARKRNRAGDYLFISQNVFSDSACVNCPPKLNCKEFI